MNSFKNAATLTNSKGKTTIKLFRVWRILMIEDVLKDYFIASQIEMTCSTNLC